MLASVTAEQHEGACGVRHLVCEQGLPGMTLLPQGVLLAHQLCCDMKICYKSKYICWMTCVW
jgi:hypothetical protein